MRSERVEWLASRGQKEGEIDKDSAQSRVLVSGLNQWEWEVYFVSTVVTSLRAKLVYWEVEPKTERLARSLFPETDLYVNRGTKQQRSQYWAEHDWPLVDPWVVEKIAAYDLQLWPSFLRNAQLFGVRGDMSLKDEYHRAITYRYYFIKHSNPNLYIFGNVPTGFYTYVDYVVCKLFSIDTVILRRIELPGCYALPLRSFETLGVDFQKSDVREDQEVSDPEVRDYILRLSGSYADAMPQVYGSSGGFGEAYKIDRNSGELKDSEFWLFRMLKEVCLTSKNKTRDLLRAIVYFCIRRSFYRLYRKLADPNLPLKAPYVLVNLHYQPEASSIPLGGMFAYQDMMIGALSRAVPDTWQVYVKEHPTHLLNNRFNFSLKFRHPQFYRNLLQYTNVRLVPVSANNFTLIDNAKAVATLTGTSGFEAINRGIPCLAFGYPWYLNADGCFSVRDQSDVEGALKVIEQGYTPNKRKMVEFVNHILDHSISGMFLRDDGSIVAEHGSVQQYGENRAIKFLALLGLNRD